MKSARLARFGLVLGIIASLVSLPALLACSCAPPPPPAQALQQSVAVFLGKVVEVEVPRPLQSTQSVTLNVERWWKGGEATQVKVVTSVGGASCGFGFQKDKRYLVYAHARANEPWSVSLCSRTVDAQQPLAAADMKELGEGKLPKAK